MPSVRRLIFSMKFVLEQLVNTDAGLMSVRTISHYLFFKKPRTTIFSAANPFKEDTLLTFAWDTTDSDNWLFPRKLAHSWHTEQWKRQSVVVTWLPITT
jgi:hypothetical protein